MWQVNVTFMPQMSGIFRFKQFDVDQAGCSMKINTDGVLLGAMAEASSPQRILDIGTGTGVIALMLAQRFSQATIDAIEIDPLAAEAARQNFERSPFAARMVCRCVGLADFEPAGRYDLIVSNPPYFVDSLKNPDVRKRLARHADWPFFSLLLNRATGWLTTAGSLQLILPVLLADELRDRADTEFGLACQWHVAIHSFAEKAPIRRIVSFGSAGTCEQRPPAVIYAEQGKHSMLYRQLLGDFFLAF